MHRKLLLALATSLSIALSGCVGGGLLGLAAGAAANRDVIKWNDAVDYLDRATREMNAADATAVSRMRTAINSPTRSSVAAARRAVDALFEASQTAEAAALRAQSLGQSAGADNDSLQSIANTLRGARTNISEARSYNTRLNGLGFGQAAIGSGSSASGPRIYDRAPDRLLVTTYAYDVAADGTITTRRTSTAESGTGSGYTDREGNQVKITLNEDQENDRHDTTYEWHFTDGRANPDYFSLLRTVNGVPVYMGTHDHSNNGETHRTLLAAGRRSAGAVTGHYDPASRPGASEDVYALTYVDIYSAPRTSATYRGAMVGTELVSRAALVGESLITYSYSSSGSDLDVRLHNIRQHQDGEVRAATYRGPSVIRWNDVLLAGNIFSEIADVPDGVSAMLGAFSGPDRQEIGGRFEHDIPNDGTVVGAFVAKK